jgi:hypothetical protein
MAGVIKKLRRAGSTYGSRKDLKDVADDGKGEGYAATAKHSEVRDVGKMIKSTKKRVTWVVGLCSADHTIELVDSIMSGKKQVFIDGVPNPAQPYKDPQV